MKTKADAAARLGASRLGRLAPRFGERVLCQVNWTHVGIAFRSLLAGVFGEER